MSRHMLAERKEERILCIALIIMFFLLPGSAFGADETSVPSLDTPWCTVNPARSKYVRVDEMPDNRFHIVTALKQANAKKQLSQAAYRKITRQEALEMIRPSDTVTVGVHFYLIRASAFGVSNDYEVNSLIKVFTAQENKAVVAASCSLSHGGSPTNFAIVVETDFEVQDVEVTCLGAS